jgi:ribosomal protein S27E
METTMILIPKKPIKLECPECGYIKYKRSDSKKNYSCASCGKKVEWILITEDPEIRLIKCTNPDAKEHKDKPIYQWYSGKRKYTTCQQCGKTIPAKSVPYTEFQTVLQAMWDEIPEQDQDYYLEMLEKYPKTD